MEKLHEVGQSNVAIAHTLGVTEGAVRYKWVTPSNHCSWLNHRRHSDQSPGQSVNYLCTWCQQKLVKIRFIQECLVAF